MHKRARAGTSKTALKTGRMRSQVSIRPSARLQEGRGRSGVLG